jgi:hypothetical protein
MAAKNGGLQFFVFAALGVLLFKGQTCAPESIRLMRAKLGFKVWPKDVVRHTCASMLMAEWEDEGKVAALLGNSPGILHAHYRELVSRAEAKRFGASFLE